MTTRILAVLALVLTACGGLEIPPYEPMPRELEAEVIVWEDVFDEHDIPAPHVVWWTERCPDYPDDPQTAVVFHGKCYSGVTHYIGDGEYQAEVAWRGSFSSSAYAHELRHMYFILHDVWTHPEDDDAVREANIRLRGAGL